MKFDWFLAVIIILIAGTIAANGWPDECNQQGSAQCTE